jgi:hypothetical protein
VGCRDGIGDDAKDRSADGRRRRHRDPRYADRPARALRDDPWARAPEREVLHLSSGSRMFSGRSAPCSAPTSLKARRAALARRRRAKHRSYRKSPNVGTSMSAKSITISRREIL